MPMRSWGPTISERERMSELTDAALDYLSRGLHLLALTEKRPNPRYHGKDDEGNGGWSWDLSIHGYPEKDADLHALAEVFDHESTTGVALLIPEHFLVADIDTDEAASLFLDLAGDVPETVVAKTPNGLHAWYLAPGAAGSRWVGERTLLFKGLGGYVAAPPSRHFDRNHVEDGRYEWISDFDAGIADLPDGIAAYFRARNALEMTQSVHTEPSGRLMVVPMGPDGRWTRQGWSSWHLEGLCRAIRDAKDGNQNNMIAWAAMQARDEGVPYDVAMPLLLNAALEGGHPRHRAVTTIKGAFTRGPRG